MLEVVTDIMRYTFEYDAEEDIVKVHATGTMDDKTFREVAKTYWSLLKEHDCWKSLIDYRRFEFTKSIHEIYKRPRIVIEEGGTRRFKMAVLVDSISSDYRFLETVYINEGIQIRMFTSSEDAMEWL